MLPIYFNPYPSPIKDRQQAKQTLLSTANAFKKISEHMNDAVHFSLDNERDHFQGYVLHRDDSGVMFHPKDLIRLFQGKDRECVLSFVHKFSMGKRISRNEIKSYENEVLEHEDIPVEIIALAAVEHGMVTTLPDDDFWRKDFLKVNNRDNAVPNIWGQMDVTSLHEWFHKWSAANYSFQQCLKKNYKVTFCPGACNKIFPNPQEQKAILEDWHRAHLHGYDVDNKLIKQFKNKHGNMLELRSYNEGCRVFFIMCDAPVIGGFYKKSATISQNKAGEKAAKRLKKEGYF